MNVHNSPKNLESGADMSDVAIARGIIAGIWPIENGTRTTVINAAYCAIKRVERSLPSEVLRKRKRIWTERRVRSIVDSDDIRVEHYEILDLQKMALREAREQYEKHTQVAQKMARFLRTFDASSGETAHDQFRIFLGASNGPGIEALRDGRKPEKSFLDEG